MYVLSMSLVNFSACKKDLHSPVYVRANQSNTLFSTLSNLNFLKNPWNAFHITTPVSVSIVFLPINLLYIQIKMLEVGNHRLEGPNSQSRYL